MPEYAAAELGLEKVFGNVWIGVEAQFYAETTAESDYVPDGCAYGLSATSAAASEGLHTNGMIDSESTY